MIVPVEFVKNLALIPSGCKVFRTLALFIRLRSISSRAELLHLLIVHLGLVLTGITCFRNPIGTH